MFQKMKNFFDISNTKLKKIGFLTQIKIKLLTIIISKE